jgi:hypothetical protein
MPVKFLAVAELLAAVPQMTNFKVAITRDFRRFGDLLFLGYLRDFAPQFAFLNHLPSSDSHQHSHRFQL